jgi:hypothetical protein
VQLFASHRGIHGVGLNAWTESLAREPVRYWWGSFWDQETPSGFVGAVDGAMLEGVEVRVLIDDRTKEEDAKMQSRSCLGTHRNLMDLPTGLGSRHDEKH